MYTTSPAAASLTASLSEPEPAGWVGELSLDFTLRDGRTLLSGRRHRGPFTVQRPFYPEDDLPHVYLLHPPGGVVGGDRLQLNVTLGAGSRALLTMPGATKFYRSAGAQAPLNQHFTLGADSALEWLPQGNIFFPGAMVKMQTDFYLAPGARLIGFETLCFGRPVMAERFSEGELDAQLRIGLPASAGLIERLRVTGPVLDKLGGYSLSATLFAAPANEAMLALTQAHIAAAEVAAAGATLLDELLVVRALEEDNQRLQGMLHRIWSALRPGIMGRDAVAPRIWST
ncbi:urease accessory protein UreD [Candidatus Sodalis endolongispinus]|uniref:Urease accessory protein UreD n=1 Tax=Candidatus Sodalis endolongispinus TaxID=2812662 RepID=A0ABS5YCD6_9GAMM|nr:urease accessory protein UreD [Candidatus Sodalis endolongispinus]MBT9432684.1 urease accessory protein UreD [Candidatus Sodalis endolongispinus]